ncbi:methyltransferase [Corynebacterium sp. 3HC-13]|uniref:DUF7782 domain-containing protein n=1 Tax=Corynebacterium poyangense TaxID=2684405 RepID=UPI001CCF6168|nr:class I SAM-dependent methyltransferase [Corynebacterium poyangense]MBZ8177935.1 methyltransferase [Corynebacterium poyangense]
MSDPTQADLRDVAAHLAPLWQQHSYTSQGLADYLGPSATAALYRGEPGAVRFRLEERANTTGSSPKIDPLHTWIRLLILGDSLPTSTLHSLMSPELFQLCTITGLLVHQPDHPEQWQCPIDIRPHHLSGLNHWVFSDRDASMHQHTPSTDHVLGVGAASLSLLNATPTTPVSRLLDLGCGSGIQALGQWSCAQEIIATDIHAPALRYAEATFASAQALHPRSKEVQLRLGPWFEPVQGETFDRIVANPPFVVGPPDIGHVYRDSGLDLDGATQLVITQSCQHLAPGGQAFLLGAWVHQEKLPWQHRVSAWLPDHGFNAWVIQRDNVDPELYVGTWLKDEGLDPRSSLAQSRSAQWLQHFSQAGVNSIGFGIIAIERLADHHPSEVVAEEIPQPLRDPLGPEIAEYFTRTTWLREHSSEELRHSLFQVRPNVAKEEISVRDRDTGMGFRPAVTRLTRTDGPQFSHEIDDALASIISGLQPEGMTLYEVAELYATVQGLDLEEPVDGSCLLQQVETAVVDLIRHGLVLPADLVSDSDEGKDL